MSDTKEKVVRKSTIYKPRGCSCGSKLTLVTLSIPNTSLQCIYYIDVQYRPKIEAAASSLYGRSDDPRTMCKCISFFASLEGKHTTWVHDTEDITNIRYYQSVVHADTLEHINEYWTIDILDYFKGRKNNGL